MKDQVKLFKLVFDTLNQLTENQLHDLLNKKAKLKISYVEEVKSEQEKIDDKNLEAQVKYLVNELSTVSTREEAISILSNSNINKNILKSVSKSYSISLSSKDTNTVIIEKIVESLIGSKLRFDALLNTNLKN